MWVSRVPQALDVGVKAPGAFSDRGARVLQGESHAEPDTEARVRLPLPRLEDSRRAGAIKGMPAIWAGSHLVDVADKTQT